MSFIIEPIKLTFLSLSFSILSCIKFAGVEPASITSNVPSHTSQIISAGMLLWLSDVNAEVSKIIQSKSTSHFLIDSSNKWLSRYYKSSPIFCGAGSRL